MNNVLYAPPIMRDGELYRGVVATDDVAALLGGISREKWVLLWLGHGAFVPDCHADIDLYQLDPFFGDSACHPQVNVSLRELTDPTQFFPTDTEKEFDVIFNAHWDTVKRPEILLDALTYARKLGRPISCLWFGQEWPLDYQVFERRMMDEVRSRDLPVTFEQTSYAPGVVNQRYNRCRTAAICSSTESGPRVLAEAMLADLPYIATRDTYGGSPAYINERNGLLCDPHGESLAEAIWFALDHYSQFQPRDWALENMCRPVGMRRLKDAVQQIAVEKKWRVNHDLTYTWTDWNGTLRLVEKADEAVLI